MYKFGKDGKNFNITNFKEKVYGKVKSEEC